MDHTSQSQLQALTGGFKKPESWKVALQVLIPVTVFTFLFVYSITRHPSILYSINLFSPSLLDAFINKRAIFLFCNFILMFLVQDSGLIGSGREIVRRKGEHHQQGHSSAEIRLPEEEEVEKASSKEIVVRGKKAQEEEEKAIDEEVILKEEEAHEEEEEECMGIQNLDELNKRCDEFIKRMNREMRLEALQLVFL